MVMLTVTDRGYVWVKKGQETLLTLGQLMPRLATCSAKVIRVTGWPGRHPDESRPGHRCKGHVITLWYAHDSSRRQPRLDALRAAVARRRAKLVFNFHSPHGRTIHRSRATLGASAAVVPATFDFSRQWLVHTFFPNGKWRQHCLDSDLIRPPSAQQGERKNSAKLTKKCGKRGSSGSSRSSSAMVRRIEKARWQHVGGVLEIVIPMKNQPKRPKHDFRGGGRCHWAVEGYEPVLVPVPHTNLQVFDTVGYTVPR